MRHSLLVQWLLYTSRYTVFPLIHNPVSVSGYVMSSSIYRQPRTAAAVWFPLGLHDGWLSQPEKHIHTAGCLCVCVCVCVTAVPQFTCENPTHLDAIQYFLVMRWSIHPVWHRAAWWGHYCRTVRKDERVNMATTREKRQQPHLNTCMPLMFSPWCCWSHMHTETTFDIFTDYNFSYLSRKNHITQTVLILNVTVCDKLNDWPFLHG